MRSGLPSSVRDMRWLLPRVVDPGPLYRMHRRDHQAASFGNRSIFRFDPPVHRRNDFGTFYAATSPAGAFLETLGSIRPVPEHLIRERVITNLIVEHDFLIADLTHESVIRGYGDLSASGDFRFTQDFAAMLWDAGFAGLQYFPSHHQRSGEFAVALLAEPGVQDDLFKTGDPEPIRPWLLHEVKSRFDIDVFDADKLDHGLLPWAQGDPISLA